MQLKNQIDYMRHKMQSDAMLNHCWRVTVAGFAIICFAGSAPAQTESKSPAIIPPVIAPAITPSQPSVVPMPNPSGNLPIPEKEATLSQKAAQTKAHSLQEKIEVKSLFFTPDDLARIQGALEAYEQLKAIHSDEAQNQAQDFLNKTKENDVLHERDPYYPQFYLESLVYHTPESWSLQVNGQKIASDDTKKSALKVISIDEGEVTLEWQPLNMAQVQKTWANVKNDNKNADVMVDETSKTVIFTLHPNQTFSSYVMRVLEGKVQPVPFLDGKKAETLGNKKKPPKTTKDKKEASGDTGDGSDEGLTGLMNRYKKMKTEN